MRVEAKVGLFVVMGLVMLFLLTTQINRFVGFGKEGYEVFAILEDASGLEANSKIKAKGVEIGYVKSIFLDKAEVKAELFIYERFRIPSDSAIELKQSSLLGSKYLAINIGNDTHYLENKDMLQKQITMVSFEETSDKIGKTADELKSFVHEFKEIVDDENKNSLKNIFQNLNSITAQIDTILQANRSNLEGTIVNFKDMGANLAQAGKDISTLSHKFENSADVINKDLPLIMERIAGLTKNLELISAELTKRVPQSMDKIDKVSSSVSDLISDNQKPLSDTIKSANDFFAKGSEGVDTLNEYLSNLDKSEIQVNFRSEYQASDAFFKSYASLAYVPNPTKYYMLDVVASDDYSRMDKEGVLIAPKKHEDSQTLVSAQYGRRYGDVLARVGIIENTGGVGMDYYMLDDKLKLSFEAYDFNAINDVRGDKAHLKAYARYRLLDHLDTYVGIDNFLNSQSSNIFFGLGIGFIDNDMKTLLGSAGSFAQ